MKRSVCENDIPAPYLKEYIDYRGLDMTKIHKIGKTLIQCDQCPDYSTRYKNELKLHKSNKLANGWMLRNIFLTLRAFGRH
jgi:hypothetical protein